MSKTLQSKTALVTGGSRGIGAAIAQALAAAGAAVVVNYARDQPAAEQIVSEIKERGGRAWAMQGDISKPEQVRRLYAEVAQHRLQLDILVHSAGIYEAGPIDSVTPELFHRLFDTNVLGLLLSVQAALPLFSPAGGCIINIGALAAQMASGQLSVYSGSKGAIDAITRSLSKELGGRNIRVNSLNPGTVETDGLAKSGFLSAPMRERILASTSLGRLGKPSDIANAVLMLASDASYWITGQNICAAGGLTY